MTLKDYWPMFIVISKKLELKKEQILKRFSEFRESISLRTTIIERQLEECVKAKDTYSNFLYSNLNAVEIASNALCAILTSTKTTKDTWVKGLNSLKASFDNYMKMLST